MRGRAHLSYWQATLLQRLRRQRFVPRFALPLLLAVFFATALAHAAHLHKPDEGGKGAAAHCELCLQFARIAPAPPAPALVEPLVVSVAAPPAQALPGADAVLALAYRARAPPLA